MARLSFEHFWRDVVWRSTNCALFLSVEVKLGGEAEVAQLDLHLVVQEEVAKLQVAVNNPVLVQVLQSVYDLHGVALNFQLVQSLAALQQLVHALVLAQFEQDVHVLAVFKEVLEVAHVAVLDAAVDFDLAHQLLLGSTFGQARLLNDFGRVHESGVGINEFVAFGESALAQELALDIPANSNFAIFLVLLLDDCLAGRRLPWLERRRAWQQVYHAFLSVSVRQVCSCLFG